MPVAEARAIVPALHVHNDDPASDRRALQKLAALAERFSPIVGLEEGAAPECLFLDITGCADCFHGEDRLIERARDEFDQQGWNVRIAVADTLGLAWALAHFQESGERRGVSPTCELQERVGLTPRRSPLDLPVAALRLPMDALQTLLALGIDCVGQ